MAAVGTPAMPSHSAKAHAIATLEKEKDIQRLMKVMVSQMQHMSTTDQAFLAFFLHKSRKEQSANTAPSVALDDLSRVGRGRGGGQRGSAGSYAAGQNR
eukprot:6189429-Pleurochrysis_carterae.AAC.2